MALVTISTFNVKVEAELAKSRLEDAGVKAIIHGLDIGQGGGAGMAGVGGTHITLDIPGILVEDIIIPIVQGP